MHHIRHIHHIPSTNRYGLIGYPLGHSFSPAFFAEKFRREGIGARYDLFPIAEIGMLPALIAETPGLCGLNVTIPYKQAVMPFLHRLDAEAAAIGAVNCIDLRGEELVGYNTDCTGFRTSLVPLLQPQHRQALVLGTGGAAQTVRYVLGQLGIGYKMVSRSPAGGMLSYAELTRDVVAEFPLIVNTTPAGMHPHEGNAPVLAYEGTGSGHLLYDLVYNPPRTRFLELGAIRGAQVKNGLEMLELQAEAAWTIWNR